VEIQTIKPAALIILVFVFLIISIHGEEANEKILKELSANEILDMIQSGESVEYDHIMVNGNLNLRKLDLPTNITTPIRLNDSIFNGSVIFTDAILEGSIDLSGSNFYSNVVFKRTIFNGYADLRQAKFGKYANFNGATFGGSTDFQKTAFDKTTYFNNVLFGDSVNFGGATFSGEAEFKRATFWYSDFSRATFRDDADFSESTFNGEADFGRATFSKDADFDKANFREYANFGGGGIFFEGSTVDPRRTTLFNGDADFNEVIFGGGADFGKAKFFRYASFDEAIFNGDADFNKANFSHIGGIGGSNPSFYRSTFNRDIDFSEAIFSKTIDFIGASFKGDANFNKAYFNKTAHLSEAIFEGYLVGWEDLKSALDCDEATYLRLINNFKDHGQFGEADDCYFTYRYVFMNNLSDILSWISCGFGVRPLNSVYLSIIIIILFGIFYWIGNGIYKISGEIQGDSNIKGRTWNLNSIMKTSFIVYIKESSKFLNVMPKRIFEFLRLFRSIDLSKILYELWHKSFTTRMSLNDSLYFSALVFFTLHPPHGWEYTSRWRYMVLIEDILGGIFITLFIVTLSNIMIRY